MTKPAYHWHQLSDSLCLPRPFSESFLRFTAALQPPDDVLSVSDINNVNISTIFTNDSHLLSFNCTLKDAFEYGDTLDTVSKSKYSIITSLANMYFLFSNHSGF